MIKFLKNEQGMRHWFGLFLNRMLVLIMVVSYACSGNDSPEADKTVEVKKDDLLRANQFLVGKDNDLIRAYAKRRNWNIDFTGTGLAYDIYEYGSGPPAVKGSTVTIEYKVSLLDGKVCYTSEKDGPKSFRVGQGGVEAGLEEGMLMLNEGDKARFILPPFLAHGLIGDQISIPPRAIVVYELELVNVSQR